MPTCTFFGHRDFPEKLKVKLREVLVDLITDCGVDLFYVGNQGKFDACVYSELNSIRKEYPQIKCAVVLAYLPVKKTEYEEYSDAIFPEGIERVYPRYAISWRNDWMLEKSDYVVTYVVRSWGGASQYANKAKKQGKVLIELSRFR